MAPKVKLDSDEILRAEFDYIAQTAFQANEDRARVTSFYFVSVGSLVAAILGTQFAEDDLRSVSVAFSVLFLALTALGGLTIAQLARLRAAWHESAEAMNQLKDFYIQQRPEIEPAFKWRLATLPPTDKAYSIANLLAVEVSLLGSLTAAAAVYFLLNSFGKVAWWGWLLSAAFGAVGYLAHWLGYKHLLVDNQ